MKVSQFFVHWQVFQFKLKCEKVTQKFSNLTYSLLQPLDPHKDFDDLSFLSRLLLFSRLQAFHWVSPGLKDLYLAFPKLQFQTLAFVVASSCSRANFQINFPLKKTFFSLQNDNKDPFSPTFQKQLFLSDSVFKLCFSFTVCVCYFLADGNLQKCYL
jgi:hypothetical protein